MQEIMLVFFAATLKLQLPCAFVFQCARGKTFTSNGLILILQPNRKKDFHFLTIHTPSPGWKFHRRSLIFSHNPSTKRHHKHTQTVPTNVIPTG